MMMKKLFLCSLFFLNLSANLLAQYGDCSQAKRICKKESIHMNNPRGEGNDRREADFIHCFLNGDNMGQAEENSTWIQFEIKEGGTLSFAITPDRATDDIDFVVFRLPSDGNCARKEIVRCMAAGDDGVENPKSPCLGATGLRSGEKDSSEDAGCKDKDDNTWLAPLKTVAGEKYVLLISNVTGPRGFSISFSGSAKLPCEEIKPLPITKPAPPKKTEPIVVTPPNVPEPPKEINGRAIVVDETVKVQNRKITLSIWDSQIEDGDIISVYIGNQKVVDRHRLTKEPQQFVLELPAGKEHYLTIFADDFGKSEPNTAAVLISDGKKEQRIELTAGRKQQESVKIILE
jgi:hypothetical protein